MAADMDMGRKRPIILPKDSSFTKLLVRTEHEELLHSGVGTVMTSLRTRFWILGLRGLVKRTVRECVVCRKNASKAFSEETAPLPSERVSRSPAIPFLSVGVDYAGPLFIECQSGQRKVYILLLTCTRIRAIHLELTSSLNTSDFIAAFERFAARRGLPKTVMSDNAKTFKRASEILSSRNGIKWKFITERAPWHGGIWERLVRSVKLPLRKALHRRIVGFEELQTLLCRIECVINDRPITYVENSSDIEPLCPSHFLLGRISRMNELVVRDEENLRAAVAARRDLLLEFWSRWQSEYLPLLNATFKGSNHSRKIQEGDVVLVFAEKGKHLWPLARVKRLHPGMDGKVRTASIECGGKILRRPIQKLYFLESTAEDDLVGNKDSLEGMPVDSADGIDESVDSSMPVESVTRSGRVIEPPQKYGFD